MPHKIVVSLLALLIYGGTWAKPPSLTNDQKTTLRQAVIDNYHAQMQAGQYYDALTANPYSPHPLRITDCVNDHCLLVLGAEPGWSECLYLLTLRDGMLRNMRRLDHYGAAAHYASFVVHDNAIDVYIESTTHAGESARELIRLQDNVQGTLASQILSSGKTISTSGNQAVLLAAMHAAETKRRDAPPIHF
jgi:hypothetical protein